MVLHEGQVLGPYRVVALAGSGGMGEVWRARDDRLQRDVALKVLHASLDDPDARRRLLAEARSVSALNHPHIVVVHDVLSVEDRDILVMEFVTGDVLTQRIPAGGMTPRDALKIAITIADAVAAAHAAGVVHRDLKPANVMVGPSGAVKVLDFGLARRRVPTGPSDLTVAGDPQSVDGLVSGTPVYMSPEQAEGRSADHRSDVFSFGTLLYELLTGERPFEQASVPETLAAVIKDDPRLPPIWPLGVARIVRRCLRKQPEHRYQHFADVTLDLQEALETVECGAPWPSVNSVVRSNQWKVATLVFAAIAALLGTASWRLIARSGEDSEWQTLPLTSLPGLEQQPALSPAADRVAFMWDGGDLQNHDIYVQHVDGAAPALRLTTDPAADSSPCWSPDGLQVAFLRLREDATDVMIVSALSGAERRAARIERQSFPVSGILLPTKIDWSPDGRFIAFVTGTVSLLNVETGEILRFKPAPSAGYDRDPAFAPDSRAIAYSRGAALAQRQLWIQRIDRDGRPDGAPELLNPQSRPFSALTWLDGASLLTASGFPGSSVELVRIGRDHQLKSVPVEPVAAWYPHYRQAQQRLTYQRRTIDADIVRLNLGDSPTLESRSLVGSTHFDSGAKYSPDGTKIVFTSTRTGQSSVWRANSDGTNQILIGGFKDGVAGSPRWAPDGESVVFDASIRHGETHAFIVSAEGGAPRRLTSQQGREVTPSVSRDGRWVYFSSGDRIWKVSSSGGQPIEVASGSRPHESIDGHMLYFSRGDQIWRTPTQGGPAEVFKRGIEESAWSLTSEELYEVRVRPHGASQLLAHNLQTHAERIIFEFPPAMKFYANTLVDVSPDGQSALVSPVARDESDLVVVNGIR